MTARKSAKRPTSLDVARLAGVSQSTVSNVLNNHSNVAIADETRVKVLQAIAQLDYQPHEAARNLRSQSSRILGMTIPEMHNMHYMENVVGVDRYVREQGYSLFLAMTGFSVEQEQQSVKWLKQKRYDALILTSAPGNVVYSELHASIQQNYVITAVGFYDSLIDSVTVAEYDGEKQAIAHLVELGHTRIGHIYGVVNQDLLAGRLKNCLFVQSLLGLPIEEAWIQRCGPALEDGYRATFELLRTVPKSNWPSALVVVNDYLAIGVLAALNERGLKVPEDMSVISFDDIPLAARTIPALTSVACDAQRMGEEAARLTIERLKHPERVPEHVQTQARLIVRASTGRI